MNTSNSHIEHTAPIFTAKRLGWFGLAILSLGLGLLSVFVNPLYIAGGLLVSLVGIFIFKYPFVGLVAYIFIVIMDLGERIPALGAIHTERLVAIVLIISFVFLQLQTKKSIQLPISRLLVWFGLFCLALVLSTLTSIWTGGSTTKLISFINIVFLVIFTVSLVNTESRLKVVLWLLVLLIAYTGIDSLYAYYSGKLVFAQGINRAAGQTGQDPNSLATSLASGIPFVIMLGKSSRSRVLQIAMVIIALSLVWTIILTGSRGGMVALVVMMGGFWYFSSHRFLSLAAFLIIVPLFLVSIPKEYTSRYLGITSQVDNPDASVEGRYNAWKAGMRMFNDYPVTGIGTGVFAEVYRKGYSPEFHRISLQPHSLYVQVAAELGVFGIVTWFGFLIVMIIDNRKIRKRQRFLGETQGVVFNASIAITISLMVLLATGITSHSLYRLQWYFFAGLTIAMIQIIKLQKVENLEKTLTLPD